jgi:hypothetical protein
VSCRVRLYVPCRVTLYVPCYAVCAVTCPCIKVDTSLMQVSKVISILNRSAFESMRSLVKL